MKSSRTQLRDLLIKRLLPIGIGFLVLSLGLWVLLGKPSEPVTGSSSVQVLAYSSFINSWGPGPEIATRFEQEFDTKVEYIDAGDAGLLLKKLELLPADAVVGLDQLTLSQARAEHRWKPLAPDTPIQDSRVGFEPEFLPFDWGPLAFIYRKGEIEPPKSLDDLLDPRFKDAIALQDPRTSSPGLQFFFWVLDEKGIEEGFKFLEKLKPNLHSVSGSWSAAYGTFTKKDAKLVFSYVTSPLYHKIEEKDESYAAALFESEQNSSAGQPLQIEYAGVPASCHRCELGEKFAQFLLRPDIQRLIMEKNYMMPVVPSVVHGTAFESLPEAKLRSLRSLDELLKRRPELFERWRRLGL